MANKFEVGRCYYKRTDTSESPKVMRCRKSILYGMQLVPYSGLVKLAIPCDNPAEWIDCTVQVRRTEALKNSTVEAVNITADHIGTIIAFMDNGKMSKPHLLYDYTEGVAYLMTIDGRMRCFNIKLKQCYPLQAVYKDIITRAISSNPLHNSRFDVFFRWLRKTDQYNAFVKMVNATADNDANEAMIQLFELMTLDGVTASTFEVTVNRLYDQLSESQRDYGSKYEAVLATYKTKARDYTLVERLIMRGTNGKYPTPVAAWAAEGGGRPFPTTAAEVVFEPPISPEAYIANHLGLYSSEPMNVWYVTIVPALGAYADMNTQYKESVTQYLRMYPEFNMRELDFIKEEDKSKVFSAILGNAFKADVDDPYRAWIQNPPETFRNIRRENPKLSYPAIFKRWYEEHHTQSC